MPDPAPTTAVPTAPAESTPAAPAAPPTPAAASPAGDKPPPWGDPENFTPEMAWKTIQSLRQEKGDPELQQRLQKMEDEAKEQRERMATALGLKPEETSDTEKLAETVSGLQKQFEEQQLKATRFEVAARHQIPTEFHGWLTATDPEGLDQQAQQLLPMVQATLAARGQSQLIPGQPAAPQFVPNPGQGQGGGSTPAAQDAAEYAKYYDENGRARF